MDIEDLEDHARKVKSSPLSKHVDHVHVSQCVSHPTVP